MKKTFKVLVALMVSLAFLVACGGGNADGGDKKDGITIGFAQVGSESEWRTANSDDIKRAADEAGVTLQFSDGQQKQENQIKAIRSFIASDVDIIAFTPIVATGWETVLQEAKDAGIPVLLVDRGADVDESLYVTHIASDALGEGKKSFDWIHTYINEKSIEPRVGDKYNIAILEGTVGSSVAADRLNGFKDAIAEKDDADKYEILFSQTAEYTRAKGLEVMESFLKSGGDKIDIVFAANDDMALGAIQAIEAAGLKPGEDIIIVSIDAAKGAFNAMIEGKLNAAIEHSPAYGDLIMEVAKKVVNGEDTDKVILIDGGVFSAEDAEKELPNRTY